MGSHWNDRALECRSALAWLDEQMGMPVGMWLAMHTALVLHMKQAQQWVAEDCVGWFK